MSGKALHLLIGVVVALGAIAQGAAAAAATLIDAVKRGDSAAIQQLVSQQVDANAADPDGATPLHWAAQRGDVKTVDMLLQAGARPDTATRYGMTPLALAVRNGSLPIVTRLLGVGADPNAKLPGDETPLMWAARTGDSDVVRLLSSRGGDPNARDAVSGQTPLMWAAAEGHAAVISVLVESGADVATRSPGGWTALLFAAREGQIAAVRALLDVGADVNDALIVRPSSGRRGAAPPAEPAEPRPGASALVVATANAHYELAALLLERGADPDAAAQGWTALHQVAFARKPGGGGGPGSAPPIGSGSMSGLDLVKRLVERGADLNATMTAKPPRDQAGSTELNMVGATPFLLAARSADVPLMRVLADLGADPLLPNEDGSTPLLVAAGVGTASAGQDPGAEPEVLEAVKFALELGNDINVVDKNGNTVMHGAAFKKVASVVPYLASQGADIRIWNQRNVQGWTPFRIATGVFRGAMLQASVPTADEFRKIMLAAGASIELSDDDIRPRPKG